MASLVKVGEPAPDFVAKADGKEIRLSDFKGKKSVVLLFYPIAFTPVCSTELPDVEQNYGKFRELGAEVLAISTDHPDASKAFAGSCGVKSYPVIGDFDKKIATSYGVLKADAGDRFTERATVIVDKQGKVAFAKVNPIKEKRNLSEFQEVLRKL
jgi:peroxiredoxin